MGAQLHYRGHAHQIEGDGTGECDHRRSRTGHLDNVMKYDGIVVSENLYSPF